MHHVTIIDDMRENLNSYKDLLEDDFELELIQDPSVLLEFLESKQTDLILLDLHMPKINGFDLYSKFKDKYPEIPVIFLSGDPSEESIVQGLNLGAEDFIVKPVSYKELVARIKNRITMKSLQKPKEQILSIGSFRLYTHMQMAEVEGEKVLLTPIEFKLINHLVQNPNKIFSRAFITNMLWPNVSVQTQNIDTHLSNLRKKLSPFSKNIKTIKSRGYILRV